MAHAAEAREWAPEALRGMIDSLYTPFRGPGGEVVDEEALAEALESKKIAGAALDVYEHEPKVNPKLLARRDVILTPHIGSATVETRTRMMVVAANNVAAFFEGRTPPSALNKTELGLK